MADYTCRAALDTAFAAYIADYGKCGYSKESFFDFAVVHLLKRSPHELYLERLRELAPKLPREPKPKVLKRIQERLALFTWTEGEAGNHDRDLLTVRGRRAATIYANGTWHTWDRTGVGGENDVATPGEDPKAAVMAALERQAAKDPSLWHMGERLSPPKDAP
jgi:hypothetical protein